VIKEWQFNVLFFVGVGGAIIFLFGPWIGLDIGKNPTAGAGVGAILTYILTQKKAIVKPDETKDDDPPPKEVDDGSNRTA
jgi:hypothetical protein